jgi:hypothetical protein
MFIDEIGYLHETEVKADPFELQTLIGWLETKDPDEQYAYLDQGNCCLAQYFREKAPQYTKMSSMYAEGERICRPLPPRFNALAKGPYDNSVLVDVSQRNRTSTMPEWTFGKALERAKQYATA